MHDSPYSLKRGPYCVSPFRMLGSAAGVPFQGSTCAFPCSVCWGEPQGPRFEGVNFILLNLFLKYVLPLPLFSCLFVHLFSLNHQKMKSIITKKARR